ncbi:hypothetical protein B0H13DRAFT_1911504 [Mycena leptocephala]|nr:hypothetical protein B0H13DRAFT_1911504 [Mycena leptocephala]
MIQAQRDHGSPTEMFKEGLSLFDGCRRPTGLAQLQWHPDQHISSEATLHLVHSILLGRLPVKRAKLKTKTCLCNLPDNLPSLLETEVRRGFRGDGEALDAGDVGCFQRWAYAVLEIGAAPMRSGVGVATLAHQALQYVSPFLPAEQLRGLLQLAQQVKEAIRDQVPMMEELAAPLKRMRQAKSELSETVTKFQLNNPMNVLKYTSALESNRSRNVP